MRLQCCQILFKKWSQTLLSWGFCLLALLLRKLKYLTIIVDLSIPVCSSFHFPHELLSPVIGGIKCF